MRLSRLSVVFSAALTLAFTACPPPITVPDASVDVVDSGNPPARDACSGGCSANQVCDTANRICVDACGGCDAGVCVKVSEGVFQCRANAVTCNGVVCEPGQVACIAGECSCLSSLSGALDTCQAAGKWCSGKVCANPRALQECDPLNFDVTCPTGYACQQVFSSIAMCTKNCTDNNSCDRGESCSGVGCLPNGLFGDMECEQNAPDGDGGFSNTRLTVPVANTCLLKASDPMTGNVFVTDPVGSGTGNCTYAIFQFWDDGVYPFATCRPPGGALEGQTCKREFTSTTAATQCATGLECVATRGGDEGVCLRMCNAQPEAFGFEPTPACNTGESCVNTWRYTDPNSNSVLGVCMKNCDVFSADAGTCANVGTTPTSCVPTQASGEIPLSLDGTGVCIPQRAQIAGPGETCGETDPFRGAACGNAQVCTSLNADVAASCTPVCDTSCNPPSDGGVAPAACATRPNATCAGGKTCKRVTSTTGARVGFCL